MMILTEEIGPLEWNPPNVVCWICEALGFEFGIDG
jgi:hypothetical protein